MKEPLKAFARPAGEGPYTYNNGQSGMNLRDWIMGLVLSRCIRRYSSSDDEEGVKRAYRIADIAMKVREE